MFNVKKQVSVMAFGLVVPVASAQMLTTTETDLMMLYDDEETVSIATGTQKPIRLAPSVAHVITAKDIKANGAIRLDQVLEMVPGIHVSLSTVNRLNYVYSIRGIHTGQNPQTLILMNGQPFRNAYSGARPNGFHYPVENIERVEVMRGPGSAVYGADAFAAVVNIITKNANNIGQFEGGIRGGSFGKKDAWLQTGQAVGDWNLAFSFELMNSDGDEDRIISSDVQTIFDTANSTDVSKAPGALDTRYEVFNTQLELARDEWAIRLWNWQLNDGGNGAGGAQALDPIGSLENNAYLLDVSYNTQDIINNWEFEGRFGYYHLEEQGYMNLFPDGTDLGGGVLPNGLKGNPGGVSRDVSYELIGQYKALQNHHLRFSAGLIHSELEAKETKNFGVGVVSGTLTDVTNTPNIFIPNSERDVWFVSAQDEWVFASDWVLTAGIRYDDYSDFGNTTNPRLALVWATDYNLTTKLLYGRAFRAPSFGEEFAINNPVVLGNKDLKPETIDTVELAFEYHPSFDLHTRLNFFAYEVKDLIDYVASGGGTKTAENAISQDGHGIEAEFEWDVSDVMVVKGNYAWQDSEITTTGADIAYAPGQQASLSTQWQPLPQWSVSPQLNWVADRKRAVGDSRPAIADYALVDLTVRRSDFTGSWEVAGSIRNLFDKEAKEPSDGTIPDDYPLEGRSAYLEMRYNFN